MAAIIKIDTDEMNRALRIWGDSARRAVEIAGQGAVVKTAYEVLEAQKKEMERVFDRPTRWTLNAFRVQINRKDISAEVVTKDGFFQRADDYLNTQIVGSDGRKTKAFERALAYRGILPPGWTVVPGQKAKLDAYGNMSVGEIKQILSWFGSAEPYAGSTQNMTDATRAKRRKGTKTKRGFEYFAVVPGRPQRGNLHPGIYRRTFFGLGTAIEPIMIFVQSNNYKPRFDFYGVGKKVVDDRFNVHFSGRFKAEMAKRGGGQ